MSQAEWVTAVAAAAAHELNDELTIILTGVQDALRSLPWSAPQRPMLLDLRTAAQRSAAKTSRLLRFTAQHGARPSAASMHKLIEMKTE